MKSMFEQNGGTYRKVGDVLLPNVVNVTTNYEIGAWGCGSPVETSATGRSTDRAGRRDQRHETYLKEHEKSHYITLLTTGKLNAYLHDVDIRATEMYETLITQLAEKQGITEQLKADDMMAWVGAMNNISNQAKEIVNSIVIYV